MALIVLALAVVAALWWAFSRYWTDYLWYQKLGQTDIFWTPFLGRLLVGLFFAVLFFAVFYGSVWTARRLSPKFRPAQGDPTGNVLELITRRHWPGPVLLAVSAFIAIIVGISYGGRWQQVLLFLNQQEFGYADPLFGRDASFFVYTLPLWNMLTNFVLFTMIMALVFTTLTYLSDRAFTLTKKNRVSLAPRVWTHLSVLLALALVAKAGNFALQRWGLVYSGRGFAAGANYTDVHILLPVLYVLAIVTLVAAVASLANVFFRGWKLPVMALALVVLFSIAGWIAPLAVQNLQVKPDELARDGEYIARNMETTRWAFGVDHTSTVPLAASTSLTAADVAANPGTIDNIRIWEPRPARDTYSQLQEIRLYYSFNDVDIDRYVLDDKYRQVLLSAREMDQTQLDAKTWVNLHLTYTHGYGFVLSPVNEATGTGRPLLLVKDIPPVTDLNLPITRPEIYYGELGNDFVIVNTDAKEFDYPTEGNAFETTTYAGDGGISVGSTGRQIAFAFRLGSLSILTSGSVNDQSRIMFRRTLWERVQALAPFLAYDYDPYLVVRDDGSLVWMWDAYATTALFPYSQPWTGGGGAGSAPNYIPEGINYIRNSVKVVIDAYNGDITFYQIDPQDSLTNTWSSIYEDLFTPIDQMPADLRAHLRYPENLYSVQADMLLTYHMTDPQIFYSGEDAWEIPMELYQQQEVQTQPYYEMLTLPGETDPEFALLMPFTPIEKQNMTALLMARQDGEHYGELVIIELPKGRQIDGPSQVEAQISNDPVISQQLTLWDQAGSSVIRGNLLVIPIEESVVYFEPVYLQAQQAKTIPELKRVIVFYNNKIVMAPTVTEALTEIFGEGVSGGTTTTVSGGTTTTTVPGETTSTTAPVQSTTTTTLPAGTGLPTDVASLIALANQYYVDALQAQRDGDWAEYGRLIAELGRVLESLANLQ